MELNVLRDLAANLPNDETKRKEIHVFAKNLMLQTESAWDTWQRIWFSQIPAAAAQTAAELKIFKVLASDEKLEPWSLDELAVETGADANLLIRLLRALATYDMIRQISPDTFQATRTTRMLALDVSDKLAAVQFQFNDHHLLALPQFLRDNHYQNPQDARQTAFHQAFNTDMPINAWFGQHPDKGQIMFDYMGVQRHGQNDWLADRGTRALFDAHFELSDKDVADNRAVFVDVGGAGGHRCIALKQQHPTVRGRVVLEDLEMVTRLSVVANPLIEKLGIQVRPHDFFQPQPEDVIGAKVFYLRAVLHDWNDNECVQILKNLKASMASDSIIIIDEKVVPELEASAQVVNYDLIMMSLLAAKERTTVQWETLIDSLGLRIRSVYCYDKESSDSLIIVS